VLLMISGAKAQACLPDGITFSTQAEIDNFQTNYPNCTEIEGYVAIGEYDITNLNGLSVLTSIGGSLSIYNTAFTSLTGLDNLTSIGGSFIFGGTSLVNLSGLENLTSIGGDLQTYVFTYAGVPQFWPNPELTSLTGLDNLTSIGGDLVISLNESLTSLIGLANLTSVGEGLIISDNAALTNLTGLDNIDAGSITNLEIFSNGSLSTCEAQSVCNYLANPNGSVNIYDNATGCNNPHEVASYCGIALPCLPFGNYYFLSQADIDNFQSYFPNCTTLEGNITIIGSNITSLNGLSVLTSIGGSFIFGGNDSLVNLSGLENLTSIGGNLQTYFFDYVLNPVGNQVLTSLTGLINLTSIGGDLSIGGNPALTSLTGLDNIDAGSITNLNIYFNTSLSTCEVQSICDYLASPNGDISIYGNAIGCNILEEVEAACAATGVETLKSESSFTIYPNPASQTITIEMAKSGSSVNGTISIYGMAGQELMQQQVQGSRAEINVSSLPKGIYFFRLVNNEKIEFGKFIKE
jgi:hypothetical protein